MSLIRALLLTDVVDSTKLSEALGDEAMAALWAAHDRVARDLLVPHRGREIDKTDGFLMLFERARDAVDYAVAYHRALASLDPPIRARAGLHVGSVILTENAPHDVARGAKPLEVDGIAKPTAARVMSLAVGGQTLLTAAAIEELGETELTVRSHGHWRMKGVSEPVELFEVGEADAPFTPPPDGAKVYRVVRSGEVWLPVKEVPHTLPAERDAFVGRTDDLRELASRMGQSRLVSVLGIGGTGKTRLVTRFGWTWLGDHPGGVWFCDLSEARSVEDIVLTLGQVLGVPLDDADPVSRVGHALAGRGRCLVILDNFEQVVAHASTTVGRWLDRAPQARFLVTTREVVGIRGEATLALPPLPQTEAFELFVTRAAASRRDFAPDDRASIDALVRLLDALPLAIELAAARVRMMPPKVLLQRMSQRFRLLSSGGGRPSRQATLRGALDWSWDLLDADEQAALAQLAVFEGGFTLEAAEAVLALEQLWPMDAVQALVDKSLVRQVGDARYGLLMSVHAYAAERLEARGGREEVELRHGAHFAHFGTRESLDTLRDQDRTPERTVELDNLVAAARRAVARGDGSVAGLCAIGAWRVWAIRGPYGQACDVLAEARAIAEDAELCAQLDAELGRALRRLGRVGDAVAHIDAALAFYEGVPDPECAAGVRSDRGLLHREHGQIDRALADLQSALETFRAAGNRREAASVLENLAIVEHDNGQLEAARAHHEAALALYRALGDREGVGVVLGNLATVAGSQGQWEEERALLLAALEIDRETGNRLHEGVVLLNLGVHAQQHGDPEGARAYYEAALVVHRETGSRQFEANTLTSLGFLATDLGQPAVGRACAEQALVIHRESGDALDEGRTRSMLGMNALAQGDVGEARRQLETAIGLHVKVKDLHPEGWSRAQLARVCCSEGDLDGARAQLLTARALPTMEHDLFLQAMVQAVDALILAGEGREAAAHTAFAAAEEALPDGHLGLRRVFEAMRETL